MPPVGSKRSRREAASADADAPEDEVREDGARLPPLPANQCCSCGAVFANRASCRRHVSVVHMRVKPFGCEHYGATYTRATSLKTHVDTAHLGLKPHACEHCGADFLRSRAA